jgi:hypothetical protein
MNLERVLRGELAAMAASLVLFVSREISKWQFFPFLAAEERLGGLLEWVVAIR